jgi:hypothetical protein
MPPNHHAYWLQKGWNKEDFQKQANAIGENTYQVTLRILDNPQFIEQSYNSCLGIFRLANKYGKDRLENACKRALTGNSINYKTIETILSNSQDKIESIEEINVYTTPHHDQIRGKSAFQ